MGMHVHDRRRFLALTVATSAAPLLSACGAGSSATGDDWDQALLPQSAAGRPVVPEGGRAARAGRAVRAAVGLGDQCRRVPRSTGSNLKWQMASSSACSDLPAPGRRPP